MDFMRCTGRIAALALVFSGVAALAQAKDAAEENRKIAGGGIMAPGWMGAVDASSAKAGQSEKDAKFVKKGAEFDVTTGPAITYWDPKNVAKGDYTVSATFTEPKFMNLNDHPHPYGIMIAGNDLGTPQESLLYCAPYGNGRFIVRGFGPDSFSMNGRGEVNAAVHKATGPGTEVKQDVAMSVKGSTVTCSINGTVVATYDKSALVTTGKLKSTDGVYGIRFAHNTDGVVTNFKVTKP